MDIAILKTIVCLVLMITFLIMTFITDVPADGKLFASLGIITGAFALKFISIQNTKK